MNELYGIPASPGVAVAPAYLLATEDSLSLPVRAIDASEVGAEWARFVVAVGRARVDITALRDKARIEAGEEQAEIFESHLLMLDDPDLHERIERSLGTSLVNVEMIVVDI